MPERPEDRPLTSDLDADASEADALEQALPWADQEETDDLPPALPEDAAEGDALDQARTVPVPDDEEPA